MELFEEIDGHHIMPEPLIIEIFGDESKSTWVNPHIGYFASEYCEYDRQSQPSDRFYQGPLVRLSFDGNENVHIIGFAPPKVYEEMLKHSATISETIMNSTFGTESFEYVDFMHMCITDDVYEVEDHQFCHTDFGKKLSEALGDAKSLELGWFTPDICIHRDDDGSWGWSS